MTSRDEHEQLAYRIVGLDPEEIGPLFQRTDAELEEIGARWQRVAACPGAPERVSLMDVPVGEDVLLTNYLHLDVAGPFRSRHAIYLWPDSGPRFDRVNELSKKVFYHEGRAWAVQEALVAAQTVRSETQDAATETASALVDDARSEATRLLAQAKASNRNGGSVSHRIEVTSQTTPRANKTTYQTAATITTARRASLQKVAR